MMNPSGKKVVEAVSLIVDDLRALHPDVNVDTEIIGRTCECFSTCTIPEDDDACALAAAVIEHVSLVHGDLGAEYVLSLLPLGLRMFVEMEPDNRFGLAGLPFMLTCLQYQALGYLPVGFVNAALMAAERVVVQEKGYECYADVVILMAKANGAHVVVRNLLALEGIQGDPVTCLFDSAGEAIWSRDALRAVLRQHYVDEEEIERISQFLASASKDRKE